MYCKKPNILIRLCLQNPYGNTAQEIVVASVFFIEYASCTEWIYRR